jgi:pimeloyl-ACP methyl ester carboxylesterase
MTENSPSPGTPSVVKPKRHLFKFVRNMLVACGVVYLVMIGYLLYNETGLVYPGAHGQSNWEPDFEFEEVVVASTDDSKIHGWYLPRNGARRFVLIHHGNGENVPQVAERYARAVGEAANANVLVYDYRGFGKSEGEPYETGVIDDAEAMLEWLLKRAGQTQAANGIVYFGSSIGGGVAVGLAERHPPERLILDRTFDSITTAGAEQYPWVPVRLLMRNRFDSAERIKSIDVPLFQSHFTNDELCSLPSARKLFAASPSDQKEFLEMSTGGHYDALPPEYWEQLKSYFDQLDAEENRVDDSDEANAEPAVPAKVN